MCIVYFNPRVGRAIMGLSNVLSMEKGEGGTSWW